MWDEKTHWHDIRIHVYCDDDSCTSCRKAINEYNNHAYFILKYHLQSKLLFVVKECLYFNVSMNVSKGFHP